MSSTEHAEYELKAALSDVADADALRRRLDETGWRLAFSGWMLDRRYDTADLELDRRDEVLRLRRHIPDDGAAWAVLGWKGPASERDGFKLRAEVETTVPDPEAVLAILGRLGFSESTLAIDRRIRLYEKDHVSVRVEVYPHMDVLVELEGDPEKIEAYVDELGLRRDAWKPWALDEFVRQFEERTGETAVLTRRSDHG